MIKNAQYRKNANRDKKEKDSSHTQKMGKKGGTKKGDMVAELRFSPMGVVANRDFRKGDH